MKQNGFANSHGTKPQERMIQLIERIPVLMHRPHNVHGTLYVSNESTYKTRASL